MIILILVSMYIKHQSSTSYFYENQTIIFMKSNNHDILFYQMVNNLFEINHLQIY